jgi:hypothetical protein
MHGILKITLQWYCKCYCVASVTETFTFEGVQTIHHLSLTLKCKRFRNTRHTNIWNTIIKLFFFLNTLDYILLYRGSRGRTVGIATDYGLHDRRVGVRVPVVSRSFNSLSLLSRGCRGIFPVVMQRERETDRSQPMPRLLISMYVHSVLRVFLV